MNKALIEIKVGCGDDGGSALPFWEQLADAIVEKMVGVTRVRILDGESATLPIGVDTVYLEVRGRRAGALQDYGLWRTFDRHRAERNPDSFASYILENLSFHLETMEHRNPPETSPRYGVIVVPWKFVDNSKDQLHSLYHVDWTVVPRDYLADIPVGALLERLPEDMELAARRDGLGEVRFLHHERQAIADEPPAAASLVEVTYCRARRREAPRYVGDGTTWVQMRVVHIWRRVR